MQTFKQFNESTQTYPGDDDSGKYLNILGIIKSFSGSGEVVIEDDYISAIVPSKEQIDRIIAAIPYEVDYDVMVYSIGDDFSKERLTDADNDDDFTVDDEGLDESQLKYELIIYLYNTDISEDLHEIKRIIKINAKGQRRIKMQCRPGFRFDGKVCVRIAGSELVTKKKAIRKAVRTKRQKGSGFARKVARLRNRATKKRRNMGL